MKKMMFAVFIVLLATLLVASMAYACFPPPPPTPTNPPPPAETEEPPNEEPPVGTEEVSVASDALFAKITRIGQKTYNMQQNGHITIWWIGDMDYVRACDKDMNCVTLSTPNPWVPVNIREKRGELYTGMTLEPGVYRLYGHGSKTGNEGEVRIVVK